MRTKLIIINMECRNHRNGANPKSHTCKEQPKNRIMKYFNFQSRMNIPLSIKKKYFSALVIVMTVMSYQSLYSQCKLDKIKDDFGSGQSVSSKDVNLASVFPLIGSKKPWDLVMSFLMVDSSLSISVTHQSQKYSSTLSSIFFKFTDGTVLKKETPSTSGQYNTGMGYQYKWTGFDITKDELLIFASKDLLKFQAQFKYFPDNPTVEEEIKSKSIDRIKKDASCMLSEFNLVLSVKKDEIKENKEVFDYKCKYENDKVDEFTKKRTVLTNASPFYDIKAKGGHHFFQVCESNINGSNGLKFFLCHNYKAIEDADESELKTLMLFDQVEILLENDEPVSLKSDAVSELFHQAVNCVWSIQLFTIKNDSIWQKLKTIPSKTLRLSFNDKVLYTQNIDKNYTNSFMNVINCIDVLQIPKPK